MRSLVSVGKERRALEWLAIRTALWAMLLHRDMRI